MRSRRQGLVAITMANAPTTRAPMRKNMRAFTPPRNKMPMAMTTITMKAPMSGSANSNMPTTNTAAAMGNTARKNRSFTSIFRTM